MRKYSIIVLLILLSSVCWSDPFGYNKVITLTVESENLRVIHYHNWSDTTRENRFKMISTHQNPFTSENDYAYVMAIDKSSNDTIFKSPSPALTELFISEDEQFFVGISNIMLWNPYQIVAYDCKGHLLFSKHIADSEAKLDSTSFKEFTKSYPNKYKLLDSLDRIDFVNNYYFIDFLSSDMPNKLGKAWDYLFQFESPNHLSDSFSETTTNYVYWYREESPELKIKVTDDALKSVSLLDPSGTRFEVPID